MVIWIIVGLIAAVVVGLLVWDLCREVRVYERGLREQSKLPAETPSKRAA